MKRLGYVTIIVLLASACGRTGAPPTKCAHAQSTDKNAYSVDGEPIAWREPGLEQRYTAVDFNSVLVTDSAKSANGAWASVTHQSSADFAVMQITYGGLDRYALFGLSRENKLVVELWKLVPADGTIIAQGPVGGDASTQLAPKSFEKTRIFEGAQDHEPVAIEYDPADRYVVCAMRDPQGEVSLSQLDAQNPATPPVPLHDSTAIPELNEVQYAQKFDHAQLGRVFVFGTAFASHERIVLVDTDDNGVFDGAPLVGDDDFFASQGLDHFEDWVNLNR